MEPTRSMRQSWNTLVGMATDELNLECNGKMSGRKSLRAGSGLKRSSHNSKSRQKEARTGRYIEKQASNFAKYLIMGQALKSGV
jgi:hypothetical protein